MRQWRRVISLLMVLAMLFAWTPAEYWQATAVGADIEDGDISLDFGEEESSGGVEETTPESGTIVASGSCGTYVEWTLNESGLLQITGKDRMSNFTADTQPWAEHLEDITRVCIGDGVTHLGRYAFINCVNLQEVTVPDSMTSLGGYAFRNCSSLKRFDVPEGNTQIDDYLFRDCSALETVTIPDTVTTIGGCAFQGCTSLKNLEIPENVRAFGPYAFANCKSLTSFQIPAIITKLDGGVFMGCSGLTELILPEGLTYIGSSTFDGCSSLETVIIPAGVTNLGSNTLASCTSLTHVLFLGDAPTIGTNVFYKDTITALYPAGNRTYTDALKAQYGGTTTWYPLVTSGTCGAAINWDYHLESRTLTITGSGAMANRADQTAQPWYNFAPFVEFIYMESKDGNLTSIGNYSFAGLSNLEWITMPEELTNIGTHAFLNCTSLTQVMLPEGITAFGQQAFRNCSSLEEVTIPEGVKVLSSYLFRDCFSLKQITIPEAVTTIGYHTFGKCTALNDIYFQGAAPAIDAKAFDGVTATAYYGSNGHVDSWTEETCQNYGGTLTWVKESLPVCEHSYDNACDTDCNDCGEVREITHEFAEATCTEPKKCTVCGETEGEALGHDFVGATCTESKTCTVCGATEGEALGHEFEDATCTEAKKCTVCGETEGEALGHDFAEATCNDPRTCTVCGATEGEALGHTFADATCTEAKTCTVCGVTEGEALGHDYADATCTEAKKCTVCGETEGEALGHDFAEATCNDSRTCTVCGETEGNALGHSYDDEWDATCDVCGHIRETLLAYVVENGEVIITGVDPSVSGHVSIPGILDGYPVIGIDHGAFADCQGLTGITIPDSVLYIADGAFQNCENLTEVNIGSGVGTIGSYAFSGCAGLTSITIPDNVHSLCGYVFENCINLAEVTLPADLTVLDMGLFYGCSRLEYITIPDNVDSIGPDVFYGCESLMEILLPDTVSYIGTNAFGGCSSLNYIQLPTNENFTFETEGGGAFYGCSSLTQVILPLGLTYLPMNTFAYCTGLNSIVIPATVTGIGESAFEGCGALRDVYYGSTRAYWNQIEIASGNDALINATLHAEEATLAEVQLHSAPNQTTYTIGERFNPIGLRLALIYDDGSVLYTNTDYAISGFDTKTPGTKTVTVTYEGFECAFTITVMEPEVTSILIEQFPDKIVYFEGESLDTTGLIIRANWSDGSETTVTEGFTVTGYDSTVVGTQTVTVEYEGNSTSFEVNVQALALHYIEIAKLPKTEYFLGDSLDTEGLVVTLVYNDGSTSTITSGFEVTDFDSSVPGTYDVAVHYQDFVVYYAVNIKEPAITGLQINTPPYKVEYIAGEELDVAGLSLLVTYENGTTTVITDGFTYGCIDHTIFGQQAITVHYEGLDCELTVTVSAPTVTSISIDTYPKQDYWQGEELDTEGLTIRVFYNIGTSEIVADGFEVWGFESATPGEKYLTVSYGGCTASYSVWVNEVMVENIRIDALPDKTVYSLDDLTLDKTGMVVTAVFNDGHEEDVTEFVEQIVNDITAAGEYTVIVVYRGGYAAYYDITVVAPDPEPVTVTSVTLVSEPDKLVYAQGEALDTTGMILRVNYSDGTYVDITENFAVADYDSNQAGMQTVSVYYAGFSVQFDVTVEPEVVELETVMWNTKPNKFNYVVGDELDTTGLSLKLYYSDGSTQIVTEGFTLGEYSTAEGGNYWICVYYEGFELLFEISVNERQIDDVSLNTMPDQTEYVVGEAFNTDGLSLILRYNDGSTEILTTAFGVEFDSSAAGQVNAVVRYAGWEVLIPVTVVPVQVTAISIQTMPDKLQYELGEALDTSGLVLSVLYNNGNSKYIYDGFSVSGYDAEQIGNQTITVSYDGCSCDYEINVAEKPDITVGQISIGNKEALAGETVQITIHMDKNPGFVSAKLKLHYNSDVLTLVGVEDAGNFGAQTHKPTMTNPYTVAWVNDALTENMTNTGLMVTLTFAVAEGAEPGDYSITATYDYDNYEIVSWDMQNVKFELVGGNVTVLDVLLGDVNGDGEVNNLDRTILTRYLADWEGYEIDELAADVNRDGVVNGLDRMILTRYLAGWDGYDLPYSAA